MEKFYTQSIILVCILALFAGCDRRPQNLTTAKDLVIQYYENGDFEKDVKNAVDAAIRFFNPRICCGPGSAVVFDIDDTLLWSYYEMKHIQFGYVPKLFHEWVLKADTPVVPHVKRLYDFFVQRGCMIIMLTGRRFDEREATIENLRKEGFSKIDLLIMRSDSELKMSALEFKSRHRQILENKGYRIIATIGDQESDLKGGYAHYQVKIPNYTYIVN